MATTIRSSRLLFVGLLGCLSLLTVPSSRAADPAPAAEQAAPAADANGIVYLDKDKHLWIDKNKHLVGMTGKVAVRQGNLEMLACPAGTKDYESIVAVDTKAAPVHAALLAVGAKAGHPMRWDDKAQKLYPAAGTEVQVLIRWTDKNDKQQEADGRSWVRNMKTGKELEYPWVFGGSGFQKNPETGEQYYDADGGDFICVANFPTAMMDLPIDSPKAWEDHLFEPFTDRLPPKGTKVELLLVPKLDKKTDAPSNSEK